VYFVKVVEYQAQSNNIFFYSVVYMITDMVVLSQTNIPKPTCVF